MSEILYNYGEYIMLGICAVDVLILLSTFLGIFSTRRFITFLTFILVLGITFDAALIVAGKFSGSFPLLLEAEQYRYLVKGAVMPIMVLIAFYAMEPTAGGQALAWVLGLLAIGAGAASGWFTHAVPKEFAGFLFYVAGNDTPRWASIVNMVMPIVCAVFLLLSGVAVAAAKKNVSLIFAVILGAVPQIVALVTGNNDYGFLFAALGKTLMALCILICCNSMKK